MAEKTYINNRDNDLSEGLKQLAVLLKYSNAVSSSIQE